MLLKLFVIHLILGIVTPENLKSISDSLPGRVSEKESK